MNIIKLEKTMLSYTDKINELYSHPQKPLTEHLLNVAENSRSIFENLNIENNSFYASLSFLIGLCHDFAKCTSFFQKHLFGIKNSEKAYHSFLSAIFGYYVIKKYIKENEIKEELNYPIIGYICIINHHGNLKDVYNTEKSEFNKINQIPQYLDEQIKDIKSRNISSLKEFYLKYNISIDDFLEEYEEIKSVIKKDLKIIYREKRIDNYFNVLILFSVLLDSDKLDASYTETYPRQELNANLVDLYKQEKFGQYEGINEIREEAYQELTSSLENIDLNNKIYSITLPTGSGKTMSAFSFALKLRRKIKNEKNIIPRIIYTMPFLSIVDQNEEVLRKILNYSNYDTSDILIKHNSTSELSYVVNKNGTTKIQDDPTEKAELDVDKAEMLLEGWYSEIVITTFYQLAYTLISNKNKALRKFHNISNSIIIVDEAQSIPAKYNQIFKTALDYLSKKFNVWIIFMTATQPEIFKESDGILPLITNEQKYFDCFDRVNYVFHHTPMTIDDFKEKIVDIIQENNKDIMIVLNTISSSTEIFEYIQGYFDEEDIELYYLSGNIIPKEKLERIKKIKESNNRKVIVTTQLIEAGVNIDVDIIYRDFAVMDSIIQTAGRCNRNDKKEKGTVNIIHLINENKREYSSFIYDSTLLRLTEELTKDYTEISEKDFNLKISKKYYTEVNNRISHDASHNLEKIISTLKISNITHEFKLIEEDIEKIDVFIEINDEATEIWDKYNEIYSDKNLKNYEKKLKLKKINRQFNNYVLSIPTNLIGTVNYDKFIFHVGKNDIERKYNLNTGFIAQENENAYMI